MSGGLAALLDDIAAIAKAAAASIDDVAAAAGKASAKAVGVVVDDTAVTPQYVQGFLSNRELPIIWKISLGSIRNKLLFILPVALLLSQFAPWAMAPILVLGGGYLAYEGAEKFIEAVTGQHHAEAASEELAELGTPEHEARMVSGAVRTDLILSSEIMAIALAEVSAEPLLNRALILIVVAFLITALVYGVVAIIVKMDDVGLMLSQRKLPATQAFGRGLVRAMPVVMSVLSTVGIAAMMWVGGHIMLTSIDSMGFHAPLELLHHAEEAVGHALPAIAGFAEWVVDTLGSALVGLVIGSAIAGVLAVIRRLRSGATSGAAENHS